MILICPKFSAEIWDFLCKNMNKQEKINKEVLKKIKDGKRIPLLKIIRLKCLECCCWQENEVRECPVDGCILWNYRMGKNPVPKKISAERKKQMIETLKKARENKV